MAGQDCGNRFSCIEVTLCCSRMEIWPLAISWWRASSLLLLTETPLRWYPEFWEYIEGMTSRLDEHSSEVAPDVTTEAMYFGLTFHIIGN